MAGPFGARFIAPSDPATAARLLDDVMATIDGAPWIWAPAYLIDLAYALRATGRHDELAMATAAAYPTRWLVAARAIAAGAHIEAAQLLDEIGSRPDAAVARLSAAEQLIGEGRHAAAGEQIAPALEFWRSVRATAYLDAAEGLLGSTAPDGSGLPSAV
jgi:hypothetical protein